MGSREVWKAAAVEVEPRLFCARVDGLRGFPGSSVSAALGAL